MRTENYSKCFFRLFSLLTLVDVAFSKSTKCESPGISLTKHYGVKIEPVDISRVEVEMSERGFGGTGAEMKFQFKTKQDSGILFYGRRSSDSREVIALRLEDGYLHYTIRCSLAHAQLRVPIQHRINDGNWHTIKFHRRRFRGYIEVDKVPYFKQYPVNCEGFSKFVFGGVSPEDRNLMNVAVSKIEHFDGCIRHFSSSIGIKSPINYNAVSICR